MVDNSVVIVKKKVLVGKCFLISKGRRRSKRCMVTVLYFIANTMLDQMFVTTSESLPMPKILGMFRFLTDFGMGDDSLVVTNIWSNIVSIPFFFKINMKKELQTNVNNIFLHNICCQLFVTFHMLSPGASLPISFNYFFDLVQFSYDILTEILQGYRGVQSNILLLPFSK